jgi:hypothetical protein
LQKNPSTVLFSIYPNPVETAFYIDVPSNVWDWKVSIVDMLGQTIHNESMTSSQNRIEVNASNFRPGIYFVNLVSSDGKKASKKVVIK